MLQSAPSDPGVPYDYATLEYTVSRKILPRKWECVRGIGRSFGYTANEPEGNFLKPAEAVRLLADVASTNGNLLLNVGPMPGGAIQDVQMACIRGMGAWRAGSSEAVYGTSPWIRAEGRTGSGAAVRFEEERQRLRELRGNWKTCSSPPRPSERDVVCAH